MDAPTPEQFRQIHAETLRLQEDAYYGAMAQHVLARAETQAILRMLEKLYAEMKSPDEASVLVRERFESFRKEAIEQFLLRVENEDPGGAAKIQERIDQFEP